MSFISPMLAAPNERLHITPGLYVAEQKFDGHRLVVEITPSTITAWSRQGKERVLPSHIIKALAQLPRGIYDGELHVPGKKSFAVTEGAHESKRVFTIFDILELLGVSTMAQTYDSRRAYLEEMHRNDVFCEHVNIGWSKPIDSEQTVTRLKNEVWSAGGEGLIIKRRASRYTIGKRPKQDWIKIKACASAVLTVVGFKPSEGTVQNRGPYAVVVLEDADGNMTTVKTKNDAECRRLESISATPHPEIGRKLRIEFHERTEDAGYREPRWDRWEDQ